MLSKQLLLRIICTLTIFFWSYSVSLGNFDLGIHIFAILFYGFYFMFKIPSRLKSIFLGLVFVGIYSILVGLINSSQIGYLRIFLTSILFVIVQLSLLTISSDIYTKRKFILSDKFLFILIILALLGDRFIFNSDLIRVGGLFKEPSHLAISVIPFLFYLKEKQKSNIKFYILFVAPILALSFSSTFILAFLFLLSIHIFRANPKTFWLYALLIIAPLLFILFSYVDYINQRVLGVVYVSATSNISSLVYIYGWESLFYYLNESLGLGIGLNGMAIPPFPNVNTAALLSNSEGELYKNPDGSFMFSKLISEIGIIGIFIFWKVTSFLSKTFKIYQSYNLIEKFLWNSLALLVFTSLVRGVGYFDGPFLIGSLAYYVLKSKTNISKKL